MPRGYRNIFAALVGLALLAFHEAPGSGAESKESTVQQRGGSDTQQAADTVASAIRDAIHPTEKDRGCEESKDDRNSDLCAQWKAVDAAREAARYAFWTLILSGAGTGLLVWTLRETRKTSRRELRAYLSVKPLGIRQLIGNIKMLGQVQLVNAGQTPAYDVFLRVFAAFDNDKERRAFEIPDDPLSVDRTVQPGHDMIQGSENYISPKHVEAVGFVYVWGVAYYTDAFGKRRKTCFCHRYNTASRNQDAARRAANGYRGGSDDPTLIEAEKARHHLFGNDAS